MIRRFFAIFLFLITSQVLIAQVYNSSLIDWNFGKSIPNIQGLNGSFIGVHNNVLIFAGGANFEKTALIDGGEKIWHDVIYVLEDQEDWKVQEVKLPRKLADGVSIDTPYGVLCIGGSNADGIYKDVFLLKWDKSKNKIEIENLAPMPLPLAYMAGDKIGDIVYVLGGQKKVDGGATRSFLSFNFSQELLKKSGEWKVLSEFPGAARNYPIVVAQSNGHEDCLYVFSGTNFDPTASITHQMLYDVYEYHPLTKKWNEKASVPNNGTPNLIGGFIGAAPAIKMGDSHILLFGGAGGEKQPLSIRMGVHNEIRKIENLKDQNDEIKDKLNSLKEKEKRLIEETSFSKTIWAYHTITNTWAIKGELPDSTQVVTKALEWMGNIVIPGGEIRPGIRTSKVLIGKIKAHKPNFGVVNYITLIVYLLLMVLIGWYFSRKNRTTDDYFLGGGRIPWWAAGLSIYATMLSAITYLSQPALAYSFDWQAYLGYFTILMVAPFVIIFYLPFFRKLNVTTAYEYLEKRFNIAVRMFGSTSFVLFQMVRMGIVVYLPALALSTAIGIDIYLAITAMGILAILYTFMGGMEAVVWTDVLQLFILLGGLIIGLIYIAIDIGDVGYIYSTAFEDGKLQMLDLRFSFTEVVTWSLFFGSFALTLIPYTTDQTIVQRYMTTSSEKEAKKSIWLNGIIALPMGLLIFSMGTFLYVYFKEHPEYLMVGMKNDSVFPLFITDHLPAGIAGLVIAGIFSASMSSLDSSMHSVSTVVTVDYFKRFSKKYSEAKGFRVAKWTTVAAGIFGTLIACIMATFPVKSLFFLFQEVIGLFGSAIAGIFILGIFIKKANWVGTLLGAGLSIIVIVFVKYSTPINFYIYPLIAIPVCVISGFIFSLVFKTNEDKNINHLVYSKRKLEK